MDRLFPLIEKEWSRPLSPLVSQMAQSACDDFGGAVQAVLFYGSCLRDGLEGVGDEKILDFYVIVDRYQRAYSSKGMAAANWLLPPNVFYHEATFNGRQLRAKYAVVTLADFQKGCLPNSASVSIWARFSQPFVPLLVHQDFVRASLLAAAGDAIRTLLSTSAPLITGGMTPENHWGQVFNLTYGCELRAEQADKGQQVYVQNKDRYDQLYGLVDQAKLAVPTHRQALSFWRRRRFMGKAISLLRLMKASFTFRGGLDYLVWKIKRHSGVEVEVQPWMRRVPLLGGLYLYLKMRGTGAFK